MDGRLCLAVVLAFVAAGACTSSPLAPSPTPNAGYSVELPDGETVPTRLVEGEQVLLLRTNLPSGTRTSGEWRWFTGHGETRGTTMWGLDASVAADAFTIPIPTGCGLRTLVVYVTPTYFSDLKADPPPGKWQSESVLSLLGEDFEHLTGSQTAPFNDGRMLEVEKTYFMERPGCTPRRVADWPVSSAQPAPTPQASPSPSTGSHFVALCQLLDRVEYPFVVQAWRPEVPILRRIGHRLVLGHPDESAEILALASAANNYWHVWWDSPNMRAMRRTEHPVVNLHMAYLARQQRVQNSAYRPLIRVWHELTPLCVAEVHA